MGDSNSRGKGNRLCLVCGGRFSGLNRCPKDGTALVPVNQDDLVGQTIAGNYEILETIGRGGMSVVYKARHLLMKRIVALKVLTATDPHSVQRFQLEAQLAANLSHPNIVTVYDFGLSEEARPFISMDLVDGKMLSEVIKDGPIPYRQALPLFIQACDALAYAHGKGVIHRDLKPGNFMLVDQPGGEKRIKLLDFGIAKQLGPEEGRQQLTSSGQVFGSPLYMSPEQCLGQKLDARADVYSFGCVMYEVLSGCPPFVGVSPLETMKKHVREDARPFRQVRSDLELPRQLEQVVLKALERDVNRRYRSMQELGDDLTFVQSQAKREPESDVVLTLDFSPTETAANEAQRAQKVEDSPEAQRITRPGLSVDGGIDLGAVLQGRYEPGSRSSKEPVDSGVKRAVLSAFQGENVEFRNAGENEKSNEIPSAAAVMREMLGATEPPGSGQLAEAGALLRAAQEKHSEQDAGKEIGLPAVKSKLRPVLFFAVLIIAVLLCFITWQWHW